jgi:glycosyltransferase involved in cell wall biosynthesis
LAASNVSKERLLSTQTIQRSVDLLKTWGQVSLSTGQTLAESLSVGGVSLWEVILPYLALYRLPELISPEGHPRRRAWRKWVRDRIRVYRGWAGRLRDELLLRRIPLAADCSRWPAGQRTILFLNFWPLFYRETFQAVAERLADQDRVSTVVLSGKQSTPEMPTRTRIQFHALAGHIVPSVLVRARDYGQMIWRAERALRPELPGILRHEGNSLWPVLRLEFEWLFRAEIPRLTQQVALAEHVLDQHRPALVVSPDDADRGRIYTLLAKSRNIPSLVVQQGSINEKAMEWQCLTADAIAVFGPKSRDALHRHGVPPERIQVTGCPRFDVLTQPSSEVARQVRAELGIREGYPMVLFASQPYVYGAFASVEARREMLSAVGQVIAAVDNIILVVKAHPTEGDEDLRTLIGDGSRIIYVDRRKDIQNLIRACDVFITFFSTSGLQALIAGKPIISVRFPGSGSDNLYGDSGTGWVAASPNELVKHLRLLTGPGRNQAMAEREPARQRFIYEWTNRSDGRAAERVAEMVLKLSGLAEH